MNRKLMALKNLDGTDDIQCPMCKNFTLTYENYTTRPEKRIQGESVQCWTKSCKFYAEANEDGSLLDLFKIDY